MLVIIQDWKNPLPVVKSIQGVTQPQRYVSEIV